MKMPIDKEWYEKRAAAEGDHEIGAGGKTMTLNLTDEEIGQLQTLIDEHRGTVIPVPRGGLEPDWHLAFVSIRRRFRQLEKASRKVVEETDRIHDGEPWPIKYRAPYEAITELRDLLKHIGTPSPKTREMGTDTTPQEER